MSFWSHNLKTNHIDIPSSLDFNIYTHNSAILFVKTVSFDFIKKKSRLCAFRSEESIKMIATLQTPDVI